MEVALLTPLGSGGVAVVAVRGRESWSVVRSLFRPIRGGELPESPTSCATWFGRLGPGAGDEVILARIADDAIEIHCHGGPRITRWIIDAFVERGATASTWPNWLNDPLEVALRRARTTRQARILLDQRAGAYHVAKQRAVERLQCGDASLLRELRRWTMIGRHLVEPWRIVIAGAPNVGKSSLVNVLSGYQRCVVAPIPGTTRDVVRTQLAFDGWLVEIADTAGLRASTAELERMGIERSYEAIAHADAHLWLVDASAPPIWPDVVRDWLYVRNKCDLKHEWEDDRSMIDISAETKVGIDALITAIIRRLVPEEPAPGTAIPYTADECERIERALERFEQGDRAGAIETLGAVE